MLALMIAAVVDDQNAIFLKATVGVIVAAIFTATAAQISLTYAHQVSQINVQYVDGSLVPRPPTVQFLILEAIKN